MLYQLSHCLLVLKLHKNAWIYIKRTLQIQDQATTIAESDTSLAPTLYKLGRCC